MKICQRKSDGTLWRASHPGHAGCMGFYFKSIRPYTLLNITIWITGKKVWKFEDPLEFTLL